MNLREQIETRLPVTGKSTILHEEEASWEKAINGRNAERSVGERTGKPARKPEGRIPWPDRKRNECADPFCLKQGFQRSENDTSLPILGKKRFSKKSG
jgi:hypothetical protein